MAGVLEALEQRYTKELKEYQDALVAYDQTVARAASAGPIPTVLQTGSSGISEDLQRLSTDPFMVENYPDIAAAATHLAKEEKEYLQAVDDHTAYYSNGKCDIGGYIGDRFYEYAALAEMVYKLATDSAFREQVFSQLETQVKDSAENGLLHDAWTLFTLRDRLYDQLGAPTAEERLQGIQREVGEAKAAIDRITSRIQGYFAGKWDEFKQAWAECGLGNAVVKAGIDGIFLVGELVIGGVVLKQGLKLVYTLTKSGLHRVEIMAVGTAKTLGHYEWKGEDLTAKYKSANDNHVGGFLPDHNRDLPDEPAEGMGAKKKPENDEKEDEWEDGSYRNPDDPQGVRRNPDGEAVLQDPKTAKWLPVSQSANGPKGNFGEVMADRHMVDELNYEKINGPLAEMTDKGHNGIDGVYKKDGNPPEYVIADAKYGGAGLGKLKDGTVQMSPAWVRERLEKSVGQDEAFEIDYHGYHAKILHVDKYGNVTVSDLSNKKWRQEDL